MVVCTNGGDEMKRISKKPGTPKRYDEAPALSLLMKIAPGWPRHLREHIFQLLRVYGYVPSWEYANPKKMA